MKSSQRIGHRLRELSELSPDPESAQRAMTMARAAIGEAYSGDPSRQRGVRFFWPRMAIAATMAVLVVAAIVLWFAGPLAPIIAFAQVVSQVQAVKSVRYVETRIHMPRAGEPRGPIEVKMVTILGRSRMREEWTSVTPGEPLPDGAEWYADASEQGLVMISDLAQGKIVTLDPKTKTLSVVKGFASMSADDGKIAVSKVAPAPEVDFFKSLQLFPAAKAEHIAARQVAGHKSIGFRTTEKTQRKQGVDTWTRTYWIDTRSKLPVQIEVTSESTDPDMGQSRWVLSDIVFDQPVDASLVSTEPPRGYTVHE
jgi:outer membrane lipoprotein-sorting protein